MSEDLKIIVCAKQVPDPEGPPSSFEVDSESKEVKIRGIPPVINPYGEIALEAALQIKEERGAEVIVLSMGESLSESILSKALGAGADRLILVQDEGFKNIESYPTARILSSAVKEIGGYDLLLTGRQAGDWDSGQVGLILSEFLEIPGVNCIQNVEIGDGEVTFEKEVSGGYEVVKAPMPCLGTVTSSNKIGELRYVSVKALKEARDKPIEVWSANDLEIDKSNIWERNLVELSSPSRGRECITIESETLEDAGAKLAKQLKEDDKI